MESKTPLFFKKTKPVKENIKQYHFQVSRADRMKNNQHHSFLIWFTGLSGSGKSTIANQVEKKLHALGVKTYVLDGDNIRHGINKDLSFKPKDRSENIRRIAEISKLMLDAGIVTIASFISPYKKDREHIRRIVSDENFIEVYVNTSIAVCEKRDVKGLYKKARAGEIKNMTGISAPYEAPEFPAIEIKTETETLEKAVTRVIDHITPKLKLEQ